MLSRSAQRREHRGELRRGDAAIDAQDVSVRAGDLPGGGRDLRRCRRSCRRRRDLHRDKPKIFSRRCRPRGQLPLPPGQPAWLDAMCCSEIGSSFPALLPGLDQPCPLARALATRLLCSISHANARTANDALTSRCGPRNRYTCVPDGARRHGFSRSRVAVGLAAPVIVFGGGRRAPRRTLVWWTAGAIRSSSGFSRSRSRSFRSLLRCRSWHSLGRLNHG